MTKGKWTKNSRIWGPFEAVGCVDQLTGEEWEGERVTCEEASTLLVIPYDSLSQLMQSIQSEINQGKKLDFLTIYLPGLRTLGSLSKEKVASCFIFTTIKAKTTLLKKHEHAQFAYLIHSGECLEVSQTEGKVSIRGLASRTMSQVNFGVVTKGQWLGLESILDGKAMDFGVKTLTTLHAYRISRSDVLEKLGRDTIVQLKDLTGKKKSWRNIRKSLIKATFSPYLPAENKEKVVRSGTPTVNKRIRELQSQQETRPAQPLIRPQTAPFRTLSTVSSLDLTFWFSQFPKRPVNTPGLRPHSQQTGKKDLPFAATLGTIMVPTAVKTTKKLLRRTQSNAGCLPAGLTQANSPDKSFIRNRPNTPNRLNASTSWLAGK